jgi:RNA recognition motif-containing protein
MTQMRDRKTRKSRGFAFVAYVDQRSTDVAVDNLNGVLICGRNIKVDHLKEFKLPKENTEVNEGELVESKAYKPSGPDGKGWGNFRELDAQEIAKLKVLEE